jgi:peptidyl-dipeptidase Dcp
VNTVFSNLNSANTNKEIQNIAKENSAPPSAHRDNIYLNEKLFTRVKSALEPKRKSGLNLEQAETLDNAYKDFVPQWSQFV